MYTVNSLSMMFCVEFLSLFSHLANSPKVGCPISTKKLTMTQEFLTTAEELYAALTEEQVMQFYY